MRRAENREIDSSGLHQLSLAINAGNAAELLHCDQVGGALVGGASLTADSFLAIVAAAAPETD